MYGMTKRQFELFEYLKARDARGELSPTFREMRDALGMRSASSIHYMVKALKERGMIDYIHSRARSITVLK